MITINHQIKDNDGCFTCFRVHICFRELLIEITNASDIYTTARHIVEGYSEILRIFCVTRIILHYNEQYVPVLASDSALKVYERYKICCSNG